ncbi:MAG: hypothetical protein PHS32_23165 [Rhodoferax sp.]|uniref:hypothetical protein n=1 Tax=Rhodoferax sp. TaxID=50421 RepID=UPI00260C7ACA|nr:hypothetical protein [Rhodoferax sp.]MDD5336648.1 hypothetical protein [Rhodoferax sp.]
MKTFFAVALATIALLSSGVSFAQSSNMMNGGSWGVGWMGGHGGIGLALVLVIVVAGLVAWILKRDGK